VVHAPWEKLVDAFVLILAGGTAMTQMETLLLPDKAVQVAFGREVCAHSSVVQDTLDACTADTVRRLQDANTRLYQRYGVALHHNFRQEYLVLDLDLTGLLAAQGAEGSAKGYFAKFRGRYGRQLCRVTAAQEIVCQALLFGNTLSKATLKPAIQQAFSVLQFPASRRPDLLLRWDAGFGTDKNINWMLSQGYQILGKMYAHKRVLKLARSVTEWVSTPSSPGREMGVPAQPHRYARKTRQLVVRTPKKSPPKTWGYGVLVSTLPHFSDAELVALYDARGGGIETAFRDDRQGLGLAKRRKHGMAAQQVLIHLAERAHNLIVWAARHLDPPLNQFGILRLVRDALQVNGYVLLHNNTIVEIGLNRRHPYVYALRNGLTRLLNGQPRIVLWEPVESVKEH
jgi:hypothetical protein